MEEKVEPPSLLVKKSSQNIKNKTGVHKNSDVTGSNESKMLGLQRVETHSLCMYTGCNR